MSIVYSLLIFFLIMRYVVRSNSRKMHIIVALIITIVSVITDLGVIIASPLTYLIYMGWQPLVSLIIMIIYSIVNTNSTKRDRQFNKKAKTKTSEFISTAKAKGMYSIIISFIVLIIGVGMLLVNLFTEFKVQNIVYIGSVIGFIILLVVGIIEIKTANEKFIFIIKTDDEFYCYEQKITEKFKFKYMDYISNIYRYYIIEKLGDFKLVGDIKETNYVWILKTENLNNFDIQNNDMGIPNLYMAKSSYFWYNEIVRDTYVSKGGRYVVSIKDNKVEKIDRRVR